MNYTKSDYDYYNIIRKNIKKYRILQGLTIDELASKLSVSSEYLKALEDTKKEMMFSLSFLFKVASSLNIDVQVLFDKDL